MPVSIALAGGDIGYRYFGAQLGMGNCDLLRCPVVVGLRVLAQSPHHRPEAVDKTLDAASGGIEMGDMRTGR